MALAIKIQDSRFRVREVSHPVGRIPILELKAKVRGERREGSEKTNPLQLTCFLTTIYGKDGRNKPKGDMSNVVSKLEGN